MNSENSALRRLLWLTFIESFATILLERGLYFYSHDILAFSDADNLWLALTFGVTYVFGALLSHRLASRFSERTVMFWAIAILLLIHGALSVFPQLALLLLAFPVVGFLQGVKWPIVESFISAGREPGQLVRLLGRFNTAWALAVPLALIGAGPLIESAYPTSLFAVAAALNAIALLLAWPLPARPLHLDAGHSTRPGTVEIQRLSALLLSARWAMLLSYALLFLLAPLMPTVLEALNLSVTEATTVAGVLDFARVGCFAALGAVVGWRGKTVPLVLSVVILPLSFGLILFGGDLWLVLCGEVLFGLSSGFTYSAALYYALLLKNAAVSAGGAHEGLIGMGFALGPLVGLLGNALTPWVGNPMLATMLSVTPFGLLCTLLAFTALRPRRGEAV